MIGYLDHILTELMSQIFSNELVIYIDVFKFGFYLKLSFSLSPQPIYEILQSAFLRQFVLYQKYFNIKLFFYTTLICAHVLIIFLLLTGEIDQQQ